MIGKPGAPAPLRFHISRLSRLCKHRKRQVSSRPAWRVEAWQSVLSTRGAGGQTIRPERLSSVAPAAPAGAIQVRSSMIPVTGTPVLVWY